MSNETVSTPVLVENLPAVYDALVPELVQLQEENEHLVFDYESDSGEKEARSHIHKLRRSKGAIKGIHKEAKADALRITQDLDRGQRELLAVVDKMINVHLEPIKAKEAKAIAERLRIEAEKEAERQAEQERIEKERAELEREKRLLAEKQAKIEREEREKVERERMAKEAAEKAKADAAAEIRQAKAEAAAAIAERKRLEAEEDARKASAAREKAERERQEAAAQQRREESIQALADDLSFNYGQNGTQDWRAIADAIAEGKVPHVRFVP